MPFVIGLISGTSVDGIDAALVNISGSAQDLTVELVAGSTYPYPSDLRKQILAVCDGAPLSVEALAALDDAIAQAFAQAALTVQSGHPQADLIGSHGQTVYHRPPEKIRGEKTGVLGYSLQLGRGAAIAHATGITTVSNFRAADIAAGGHGAPLVPAVDLALLTHSVYNRCVQNIGGIGNVAYLPARTGALGVGSRESGEQEDRGTRRDAEAQRWQQTQLLKPNTLHPSSFIPYPSSQTPPLGWDTGPGNVLLDLAVHHFSSGTKIYDQDGAWAASGIPCEDLVNQWLQQDFFQQPPPKSTGRELFGAAYLQQCLADANARSLTHADVLATLTELTAASIAHSYRNFLPQLPDQVLLCGGGSKNLYLKQRLQRQLETIPVLTTDVVGLNAEFKEAIAFAVLAYWRQQGIPGNLPAVTGAASDMLLGEIYQVSKKGA